MNKKLTLLVLVLGLVTVLPQTSTAWTLNFRKSGSSGGGRSGTAIVAGTYKVVTIGTIGDDAEGPGTTGTITIARNGVISGTLYSYAYDDEMNIQGQLNMNTGIGTVTDGTETAKIKLKTTTSVYTFFECEYSWITDAGSEIAGKVFGVK